MIPNAKLILGPPGCGKTYTLIQRVEERLGEGVHPSKIGVVSFTTKAINEFVERACSKFNLNRTDFPHFRTLHATGYHALGLQSQDIMGREDWKRLGSILGVMFDGGDSTSMGDGISIPAMGGSGAKYLQLIMKSCYRMSTLDHEYNYEADYKLNYSKLVQINDQLIEYKSRLNKVDFTDMISQYIKVADTPHLALLIVDEAQDLTPLQWRMVEKMARTADEVLVAGDDDQAIHRWTSVDVREFANSSDDVEVLNKSYRLPRSVWELAMRISRRIPGRLPKEFYPREEDGRVSVVGSLWNLPLDRGSWTIMARTNSFVNDISEKLEEMGYFYSRKGRWSIDENKITAMRVWKDLTTYGAYVAQVKKLYEVAPKMGPNAVVKRGSLKLLEAAGSTEMLTHEILVKDFGMLADINLDPMDVVNLSQEEKLYIRAIERRGESVYRDPRIKLSTIHAMKGGEDDNVAVYLGSTKNCVEGKHPEDEHRVFYVAVTRAKNNLFLVESNKQYRYKI